MIFTFQGRKEIYQRRMRMKEVNKEAVSKKKENTLEN
jgi:hypothetical protein